MESTSWGLLWKSLMKILCSQMLSIQPSAISLLLHNILWTFIVTTDIRFCFLNLPLTTIAWFFLLSKMINIRKECKKNIKTKRYGGMGWKPFLKNLTSQTRIWQWYSFSWIMIYFIKTGFKKNEQENYWAVIDHLLLVTK